MTKAKSTAIAPRLTAQRQLELYRARASEAPIDEMLCQAVLHLDDLCEIEHIIEAVGLAALKVKGRRALCVYDGLDTDRL